MNKKIKKIEDVVTMPITKYVTTDGKKFTDDYDANMHQAHLDSMDKAKLCFKKYGIYTSDPMIKNHKNNDQIISNDYLLTRVLHTDISSNDDLYILQAKDEEAEKEILKTFRDYLNTDVYKRQIIDYAYEEFSKSYDDIRENLKELCENDVSLTNMICEDIVKR